MKYIASIMLLMFVTSISEAQSRKRARDYGIKIGVLAPGKFNAITDVKGLTVGHTTIHRGNDIHTGVTAILPHSGNIFQDKVPAAVYIGNGFGKLAGTTQVMELGNLETPVILTNTLSVPVAMDAVIDYTLQQAGNEKVQSVNAVVGETNDGGLNDIRGRHVTRADVIQRARVQYVSDLKVASVQHRVCYRQLPVAIRLACWCSLILEACCKSMVYR